MISTAKCFVPKGVFLKGGGGGEGGGTRRTPAVPVLSLMETLQLKQPPHANATIKPSNTLDAMPTG